MGGLFSLRLFWRPEVGCCLANTNPLRIFHKLQKNPCPLKMPKLCQRHLRIVCKNKNGGRWASPEASKFKPPTGLCSTVQATDFVRDGFRIGGSLLYS